MIPGSDDLLQEDNINTHHWLVIQNWFQEINISSSPMGTITPGSTSPSGGDWGHYLVPEALPKWEMARVSEQFLNSFPYYTLTMCHIL